MESSKKIKKQIDIEEYYAVNLRSIWTGFKQESSAFWFICIYIFLEYIRPATLYPVLDILPWAQISLICAIYSAITDKSIKWVKSSANILVFLFLIIVFLSALFAFSPSESLNAIDIPILWVLAYILIINIVNTPKRLILFLLLFILLNFKMSQHGFFTFAMRGFAYTKWGVIGSPGWFRDSGDFGIAMTVFTPLVIAFVVALRHKWGKSKRYIFYFVALTGIITIVATSSRGAQLGGVAVGVWFILKSKAGLKALTLAAIIGFLVYSFLPEEMLAEYQDMGADSTSENRLAHWAWGMEVVSDKPLLGVGYNNWILYCDFNNPDGLGGHWYRDYCLEPHNTYVEALAELGIIGTIIYLLIALHIFSLNKKTRKLAHESSNKFYFYIAHGLDGGLVGYLVSSFFITVLFYPFIWIQLSMTVALHQVAKSNLE